jgi:hypothetical protein
MLAISKSVKSEVSPKKEDALLRPSILPRDDFFTFDQYFGSDVHPESGAQDESISSIFCIIHDVLHD